MGGNKENKIITLDAGTAFRGYRDIMVHRDVICTVEGKGDIPTGQQIEE